MNSETLHKSKALKSMVTIFFVILDACQYWYLWSFEPKMANLPILMKLCTLHKPSKVNSMVTIVFCGSWRLSILIIVSIGTCYLLGHSFQPKTSNAPVLIKCYTLLKIKTWNRKTNLVSKMLLLHYKQNW